MRATACATFLIFAVPLAAPEARAEEAPVVAAPAGPQSTITLNPVRFGILHFQLEFERVVDPALSFWISPIFFHHATWYPFNKVPDTTADGGGVDLGARFFFWGDAPSGAYAGPMFSAYLGTEHRAGTSVTGLVMSPGAQVGYQHALWDWLVLAAGLGASYGFPSVPAPVGAPDGAGLPHSGMWINFRTNVGIAF